ncbi:GNAT superfamily N-acetyltransferase [Neisseria sp. HSC-16F19]|nr:GNAT family N-acetyltransferase [Neisseria sp. HSC-16F19]MCP2039949.1 GNAT superfamily N-acetyltransferase [Neisseria sp. HSC-16F19]
MNTAFNITALDTPEALAAHRELVARAFPLHQNLRPHFQDFERYWQQLQYIAADRGRLHIAEIDGEVVALALFRTQHNTYQHKLFFLEDLVTAEHRRSEGIGAQMLAYCEDLARAEGCHYLSLDSATHRTRAHKFYYVHGYVADCFHFAKKL